MQMAKDFISVMTDGRVVTVFQEEHQKFTVLGDGEAFISPLQGQELMWNKQ